MSEHDNLFDHRTIASMLVSDGREQYGRSFEFICFVDGHFPEAYRTSKPTAETVLSVVEAYLELQGGSPEERFEQACMQVAEALGKREKSVRRSCGAHLYDRQLQGTYTERFIKDLVRFERDWRDFQLASTE